MVMHGENKNSSRRPAMSIEKKSLISTLKTTKKANAVKDDIASAATLNPTQGAVKASFKGPKPNFKGPKPNFKGPKPVFKG
jgi:hypothetical protein